MNLITADLSQSSILDPVFYLVEKFHLMDEGGFHWVDLIIMELKSYMTC